MENVAILGREPVKVLVQVLLRSLHWTI